jgi:hypothetical protein
MATTEGMTNRLYRTLKGELDLIKRMPRSRSMHMSDLGRLHILKQIAKEMALPYGPIDDQRYYDLIDEISDYHDYMQSLIGGSNE